jgi:hypothetical protein
MAIVVAELGVLVASSAVAVGVVVASAVILRHTLAPWWTAWSRTTPLRRGARETMLVLDRLTDPLAVQRGVVQALSRSFPGATLELMRVQTTPPEALIGA